MDFNLTKPQLLLQEMMRRFAENEVKPLAEEMDETETYNLDLVKKMREYGIFSLAFPKELGGTGAGYMGYVIAVEELSKVCGSTGVTLSVHNLGGQGIANFANPEQTDKWVRKLATGSVGCFGLTEPNAGTDAGGQQTKAVLEGDHYVINGAKMFTTNSGFADICMLMAMTDKSKGNKGISAFIVDFHSKGITPGPNIRRMGIRGASNSEVVYDHVIVP
jgi:butyryl-CoA dehydrogenase